GASTTNRRSPRDVGFPGGPDDGGNPCGTTSPLVLVPTSTGRSRSAHATFTTAATTVVATSPPGETPKMNSPHRPAPRRPTAAALAVAPAPPLPPPSPSSA